MKITLEELKTFIENFMTADVMHAAALTKTEPAYKGWIRGGLRGLARINEDAAEIACDEILNSYSGPLPAEVKTLMLTIYDIHSSITDKHPAIDEIIEKIFSMGGTDALGKFMPAMWKGINKLTNHQADTVCKETSICYFLMMPPGWEDVIDSVYDKNNPDIDTALVIEGFLEKVVADMEGDRFDVHRIGNKATCLMCEKNCLCMFCYEFKVVNPKKQGPAQCHCITHLYPKAYKKLFNLDVKATVVESMGRGDSRCIVELEFPEELVKTPEFHFP